MIKVGDIYSNRDGTLIRVTRIKSNDANSGDDNSYTYLSTDRVEDNSWYGYWEQSWFLQHFRPATKLERLLAGL